MKIFYFMIFTISIYCSAQTESSNHEFKFYKNGLFKNPKNIKLYLVKNSDSIKCNILKNKVTIPRVSSSQTVVVSYRNKNYKINDVDFSKLDKDSKIVFGIEKSIENFSPISKELPNTYILRNSPIINNNFLAIKIENLHQAKKVNFIVFNCLAKSEEKKETYKTYSRSIIRKKKAYNTTYK